MAPHTRFLTVPVAQQARHALGHEPLLPAPNSGFGDPSVPHDRVRSQPVGSQEHDATAPDVLLRSVAIANYRLKTAAIGRRVGNGDPGAHAPDSHAPHRNRISPSFVRKRSLGEALSPVVVD